MLERQLDHFHDLSHSCILPANNGMLGQTTLHCNGRQTCYILEILKTNVLLSDYKEFEFYSKNPLFTPPGINATYKYILDNRLGDKQHM